MALNNIKFGASTWLWASPFKTQTIEELFPKISKLGFDVVEIAVEDPSLIDVKKVKEGLNKYGLDVTICGAFGSSRDLTNESVDIQKNGLSYIESCLDICAELGVPFFAGPMYSAVGKARMLRPDQRKAEWDLAVKNLQTVCEMADMRGLKIALEPLNRFESDLVNTTDDAIRIVKDINHPAAKVMIDSFHMSIEERDVESAIKAAGDNLIHVQVSENYRGAPGSGQTPWHAYKKGLEAINYKGVISIESFTTKNVELAGAVCFWTPKADTQDDFAKDGLKFLKKWASE
ncbi:sugar phosphate isomerase/epimerase [Flavobacteriaceae bacterium XHP0103]|uniref:sugar phosphate isomerase/epimerase family protein n=1 Tax=Marixanthotalea marina TaxID=2844359 RepID=UPI002989F844|nr:sugar phosphate isomerase/epimerase family protein [Marixanthotalea marina]MBU3820963.1 sugar phosphate isomerase/epimerase [Marixanthotalea marina]